MHLIFIDSQQVTIKKEFCCTLNDKEQAYKQVILQCS